MDIPVRSVEVLLTWMPGFFFEGENVTFVITIAELDLNNVTVLSTNNLSIIFSQGRGCQEYRFTVHSENLFGLSISGSSANLTFPSGEFITATASSWVI